MVQDGTRQTGAAGRETSIAGVVHRRLTPHLDERGEFTEIFRQSWAGPTRPVQWNLVRSDANVLRGVHAHIKHSDYLTMGFGSMILGLCDLRSGSPTERVSCTLQLSPSEAIFIPPGVAHGFYFKEPAVHLYAVSEYWDPDDELGCSWNDPELRIEWPVSEPRLSARDAALGRLSQLLPRLPRFTA